MNNRLFIALDIPVEAKEFIYKLLREIDLREKVKWESPGKLHITLKFLGETGQEKAEKVKKILSDFSKNKEPLNLRLNRFGFFRRNGNPQILWAGFGKNEKLDEYFAELDNLLEKIGFEKEKRKFHPHVTLKRLKGNEDKTVLEKFYTIKFEPFDFIAENITLYKSLLKPSGAVYKSIEKYNLGE